MFQRLKFLIGEAIIIILAILKILEIFTVLYQSTTNNYRLPSIKHNEVYTIDYNQLEL